MESLPVAGLRAVFGEESMCFLQTDGYAWLVQAAHRYRLRRYDKCG